MKHKSFASKVLGLTARCLGRTLGLAAALLPLLIAPAPGQAEGSRPDINLIILDGTRSLYTSAAGNLQRFQVLRNAADRVAAEVARRGGHLAIIRLCATPTVAFNAVVSPKAIRAIRTALTFECPAVPGSDVVGAFQLATALAAKRPRHIWAFTDLVHEPGVSPKEALRHIAESLSPGGLVAILGIHESLYGEALLAFGGRSGETVLATFSDLEINLNRSLVLWRKR